MFRLGKLFKLKIGWLGKDFKLLRTIYTPGDKWWMIVFLLNLLSFLLSSLLMHITQDIVYDKEYKGVTLW